MEAFVLALDPKLALEVQKLGHSALDNVIAIAWCIGHLQKDYPSPDMDNLVSVLQDELHRVRKELKESTATATDKTVRIAQPVVAPAEPFDPAAGRYVAYALGVCAPPHWCRFFLCDPEGHFVASCPIRAEMFRFMQQQAGRISAPPNQRTLPPTSPAEGAADEDGSVSLN